MFCVAKAPMPARAWAQRAATAGLEEDTAMPNMPVRGQRPRIEKVMNFCPLSSCHGSVPDGLHHALAFLQLSRFDPRLAPTVSR
jgi:hypothetical protein